MTDGFIGMAAKNYTQMVQNTSQKASNMLGSISGAGGVSGAGGSVFTGKIMAASGGRGFRLGVGTSENIVVRDEIYGPALSQITQLDDLMAQRLEQTVRQIEEMCNTIFTAPETVPRVQALLGAVRRALPEFRGVTAQTTQVTQMYIGQIRAADR